MQVLAGNAQVSTAECVRHVLYENALHWATVVKGAASQRQSLIDRWSAMYLHCLLLPLGTSSPVAQRIVS
jgi:hypothetical protein